MKNITSVLFLATILFSCSSNDENSPTPIESPVLTTTAITNISQISVTSGGNITSDGGDNVTARGLAWSTTQNPTTDDDITSDGSGVGSFTSNLIGLTPSTTYYVRAYATNSAGTAYGNEVSFITSSLEDYEVFNPITRKIWMDRNLGATRAATSSTDEASYGDLYQWGRGADGHQIRTSGTIATLSSIDSPEHGDFILSPNLPRDWRSPQNDNLWQGINGINNPCPNGYRLPTETEWESERLSWSSDNPAGAFSSPLKLPSAGVRSLISGSLGAVDTQGNYWSGTISSTYSFQLRFGFGSAGIYAGNRATGSSVRCIKD